MPEEAMGTLSSELLPIACDLTPAPRVYVDANVPQGLVGAMRQTLGWDVLFVLEHDDLRRARDVEHFRRALDLGRTLVTLDHDFADARKFPPASGPGIVVLSAPDEAALLRLLAYLDEHVLRGGTSTPPGPPLRGRTITLTPSVFASPA
jgi:predicted nuclease of predicted toxin-antitoxin system